MDYTKILDQLVSGELPEYKVEAATAFDFQQALRNYGKNKKITGNAMRGGTIIYTSVDNKA